MPQMQNRQCHHNGCLAAVLPGAVAGGTPTNKWLGREMNRRDMAYFLATAPAVYRPLGASAKETLDASAKETPELNPVDKIIQESRRKAKEDSKKIVAWNPRAYKIPTQNYNASELQSFLPNLYQVRFQFEKIEKEMESPKANLSNPDFYDLLRGLNRKEPIKLLRKDAFRTRMWLNTKKKDIDFATFQYERIKRTLDEEDTQCLLLSRADGDVDAVQIRTAKKNVRAVIDAIDQMVELAPEEEQDTAKIVAETKALPPIDLTIKPWSRRVREEREAREREEGNSKAKEVANDATANKE